MADDSTDKREVLHRARKSEQGAVYRRPSDELIEQAIHGSLGNVSYIARKLGISRMSAWRRIHNSERLKEVYDEENETLLDNAENELFSIMNPSVNEDTRVRLEAIKFYLDCKGKSRGYGKPTIDMRFKAPDDESDKPVQPVFVFGDTATEKNDSEQ